MVTGSQELVLVRGTSVGSWASQGRFTGPGFNLMQFDRFMVGILGQETVLGMDSSIGSWASHGRFTGPGYSQMQFIRLMGYEWSIHWTRY